MGLSSGMFSLVGKFFISGNWYDVGLKAGFGFSSSHETMMATAKKRAAATANPDFFAPGFILMSLYSTKLLHNDRRNFKYAVLPVFTTFAHRFLVVHDRSAILVMVVNMRIDKPFFD